MLPYAGHDDTPVILVEAPIGLDASSAAAGRRHDHPRAHRTAMHRCVTDSCDCMGHTVRETLCCAIKPLIVIVVLGLAILGLLIYLAVHVGGVDQETVTSAVTQRVLGLFTAPPGTSATLTTSGAGLVRYEFDSSLPGDLLSASVPTPPSPWYYWHGVVAVNATTITFVAATLHATVAGRYLCSLLTHGSDGQVVSQTLPAATTALVIDTTLAPATLTDADAGAPLASVHTARTSGKTLYLALARDTDPLAKLVVVRLVPSGGGGT